ncbi:hypothetical protein RSAG8_12527, partial [Rhizoctonia solani AG-8 WAC10335]
MTRGKGQKAQKSTCAAAPYCTLVTKEQDNPEILSNESSNRPIQTSALAKLMVSGPDDNQVAGH